jgi:DNA topoisomerase I
VRPIPDAEAARLAAKAARLRIVSPDRLPIRRCRAGKGFFYRDRRGRRVSDETALARIRSLAIPPAYEDVRIAADPRGHIQAVGRDEAGRLQYRYHPDWTSVREGHKTERLRRVLEALPKVRDVVSRDIARRTLCREKALACAVAMMDESHIRVGNDCYARKSGGRGTATLLKADARIGRERVALCFLGKGGKSLSGELRNRALATALRRIAALKGRRLLQYLAPNGKPRPISAAEVNAYLREISGIGLSAKDFRMLGANVIATDILAPLAPAKTEPPRRRQINGAIKAVAEKLGNTPAVVRKSYVQACILDAFASGELGEAMASSRASPHRTRAENALRRIVAARLAADD